MFRLFIAFEKYIYQHRHDIEKLKRNFVTTNEKKQTYIYTYSHKYTVTIFIFIYVPFQGRNICI